MPCKKDPEATPRYIRSRVKVERGRRQKASKTAKPRGEGFVEGGGKGADWRRNSPDGRKLKGAKAALAGTRKKTWGVWEDDRGCRLAIPKKAPHGIVLAMTQDAVAKSEKKALSCRPASI